MIYKQNREINELRGVLYNTHIRSISKEIETVDEIRRRRESLYHSPSLSDEKNHIHKPIKQPLPPPTHLYLPHAPPINSSSYNNQPITLNKQKQQPPRDGYSLYDEYVPQQRPRPIPSTTTVTTDYREEKGNSRSKTTSYQKPNIRKESPDQSLSSSFSKNETKKRQLPSSSSSSNNTNKKRKEEPKKESSSLRLKSNERKSERVDSVENDVLTIKRTIVNDHINDDNNEEEYYDTNNQEKNNIDDNYDDNKQKQERDHPIVPTSSPIRESPIKKKQTFTVDADTLYGEVINDEEEEEYDSYDKHKTEGLDDFYIDEDEDEDYRSTKDIYQC